MPEVNKQTAPDKHSFAVDQEPERDGMDYGPDDDYMEVVSSIPPDLQGENVDIGDTMGENYSSEGPVKDADMDIDPSKNYSQDIVQRTPEPETKTDEPEQPAEPDPEPKEKSAAQKRIDQIIKERNEAREQAAYYRGLAEKAPEPAEPAEPELVKPKLEDFESYEDYTEALTDYKLELRDKKRATEAADAQATKTRDLVKSKLDLGYEKYDDFEDVALANNLPINDAMIEVLAECDNAADIAYHLGKNTAEALKISRLSTVGMARELGRLDSKFSENESGTKTPPKKVTKAPPPIKPVNTGSSDITPRDPEDMSMEEYINWRTRGGKRRV